MVDHENGYTKAIMTNTVLGSPTGRGRF